MRLDSQACERANTHHGSKDGAWRILMLRWRPSRERHFSHKRVHFGRARCCFSTIRSTVALACVATALGGLTACGVSSTSTTPSDQRLAARIAPTAADLGATWKQRSGVVRVPSSCPLRHATACSFRFFARSGDPAAIPGTTAVAQVFGTSADAAAAYTIAKTRLMAPQTIHLGPVRERISLQSEASRAIGGAQVTLLADRIAMTAPDRLAATRRTILIREGRGVLILIYKPGATVPFTATARRLALRMRPAR
jgi:hypothetical protein